MDTNNAANAPSTSTRTGEAGFSMIASAEGRNSASTARRSRISAGRPVLGVCVGMQILFARGVEFGVESNGCGQWPGAVTRLEAPVIPHMGWNVVAAAPGSALFKGMDADARFYFVHSYAAQRWEGGSEALLTWATHGVPFLAAVEDGPLAATQFHPEKSGDAGAAILSNWVEGL